MQRWWFVPVLVLLVALFLRARPAGYSTTPNDGTAAQLIPTSQATTLVPTVPTPKATLSVPTIVPLEASAYPTLGTVTQTVFPTEQPTPSVIVATPTHEPPALAPEVAPPTPHPVPNSSNPTDVFQLVPVRVEIPAVDLDIEPVSVGIDEHRVPIVPKHDAGWYNASAVPGEGSNVVFWGHVLRWLDSPNVAAPFARVHELQPGAPIEITMSDGQQYSYRVTQQVQARPEEVQYILPTDGERLTLVSCIGDKVIREGVLTKEFRLITIAEPQE